MTSFQKEILEFCEEKGFPGIFDGLTAIRSDWGEFDCCMSCFHLVHLWKYELPDHLHNRVMMSEPNEWQKNYARLSKRDS